MQYLSYLARNWTGSSTYIPIYSAFGNMTPCIFVMTHHEGVKYQYYARPHSDNLFDMSHDVIAARNLDLSRFKVFSLRWRYSAPEQFYTKISKRSLDFYPENTFVVLVCQMSYHSALQRWKFVSDVRRSFFGHFGGHAVVKKFLKYFFWIE